MEPSLAARLAAQRCQLTEGRRLVGTAAELQSQRESMEVRYEVPVREVDVEAALVSIWCILLRVGWPLICF
jgi:hypothetical protein